MTENETTCRFCGRSDFKSKAGVGVHEKKYCTKNPDGAGYVKPSEETPEEAPAQDEEIQERPPTFEEVEEEIKEEIEKVEEPVTAPAPVAAPPPSPVPVETEGGGSPDTPQAPAPDQDEKEEKKDKTGMIVIAVIGICIVIICIVGIWYYMKKNKEPCGKPCQESREAESSDIRDSLRSEQYGQRDLTPDIYEG